MCLHDVFPKKEIIKKGMGYKVFGTVGGKLVPKIYYRLDEKFIPVKKWIKEEEYRCRGHVGKNKKLILSTYPYGFHIYQKLSDAKLCVGPIDKLRKVKFRKGCAIGTQLYRKTIIAKEIFVL